MTVRELMSILQAMPMDAKILRIEETFPGVRWWVSPKSLEHRDDIVYMNDWTFIERAVEEF